MSQWSEQRLNVDNCDQESHNAITTNEGRPAHCTNMKTRGRGRGRERVRERERVRKRESPVTCSEVQKNKAAPT